MDFNWCRCAYLCANRRAIVDMLPSALRRDVLCCIAFPALQRSPLLQACSESLLSAVAQALVPETIPPLITLARRLLNRHTPAPIKSSKVIFERMQDIFMNFPQKQIRGEG